MLTITIIYHEGYALEKDFYVILKNPVGSVELGEPNLARITIIDDDGKLLMTIINILKVDGMSLNELVVCIFFQSQENFPLNKQVIMLTLLLAKLPVTLSEGRAAMAWSL